jgi:hypothetical protein
MFIQRYFLLMLVLLSVAFAVGMRATVFQKKTTPKAVAQEPSETAEFKAYWPIRAKPVRSETTTYQLWQLQGRDTLEGTATLTFRVVNFRTDEQLIATTDEGLARAVPVLATERRWRIGEEGTSTSVFTPFGDLRFPNTLKVSASVQDLGEHHYRQISYRNNGYQVRTQTDRETNVPSEYATDEALLEDELWNRIRLNPAALPTGDLRLLSSAGAAHHPKPAEATATLDTARGAAWSRLVGATDTRQAVIAYRIDYKADKQSLTIYFGAMFPYWIVGWEQTYLRQNQPGTLMAIIKPFRAN